MLIGLSGQVSLLLNVGLDLQVHQEFSFYGARLLMSLGFYVFHGMPPHLIGIGTTTLPVHKLFQIRYLLILGII